MGLNKQIEITQTELGKGLPLVAWQCSAGLLACAGAKGRVGIYTRQGKQVHQFSLAGITHIEWNSAFSVLALLHEKGIVTLYNHKTKKTDSFDCGMKDTCFLCWSPYGSELAIGTRKGGYVLYNRASQKKTPVVGTHSGAIIGGAWTSTDNYLVMAGADKTISVSDAEGNAIFTLPVPCNSVPQSFLLMEPQDSSADACFAVVSTPEAVFIVNVETKEAFSSTFPEDLGRVSVVTAGLDSSLSVGFSSGCIGLAVLEDNAIRLIQQIKLFTEPIRSVSIGKMNSLYACLSGNTIKFLGRTRDAFSELKELTLQVEGEHGVPSTALWSPDGQHLTTTTLGGSVISYSISVTSISAVCGNLVFYFVSNKVINVKSLRENTVIASLTVDVEPVMMAAGMGVLALATASKVYYYSYALSDAHESENASCEPGKGGKSNLITSMEYPSPIADVKVSSEYAAILVDGRVQLHSIREPESNSVMLPPPRESRIIAMGLSEHFFIYVTGQKVCVLTVNNKQPVAQYNSRFPIKRAFPNPTCTRVALIADSDALYILNPITEVASSAEGFKSGHNMAIWDQADSTVFVSHDNCELITFVCSAHSRHGPTCESVLVRDTPNENLVTPLPMDYKPVGLHRGMLICQTSSGSLDVVPLRSHAETTSRAANSEAFYNNFSLNRLRWSSQNISTSQEAEDLAVKALHMLDIELAIRVYRQLSQPSMVLCLEKIKHIHEKNLLIGHISMIMGYIEDAQNFFLRSSHPMCALEMRRDLMQWSEALQLAKDLAVDQIPIISKEYAQQLEYRGEYIKALEMYKSGTRAEPTGHESAELTAEKDAVAAHNRQCLEGTARCYIRTGSIAEGVEIALASENKEFMKTCGKLCEEVRKFDEAAQVYEKAGDVERAAALYIEKSKNLKAAGRLLPEIKSRNIIGIYATAKEREGSFKEAEAAYLQAEDWENAVRLKVEKLNDLPGAYTIVRRTKSADAAALVADMCRRRGEFGSAVEFLVLASSVMEAFELAKEHKVMFNFESTLLKQVPLKDVCDDRVVLRQRGRHGQAGLFYTIAGNYPMALKKYIEAGEPEDIEKAVEVVGKARNEALTSKLIDFLMGETDGEAKEPAYIFKLYMSLGSFEKAAKTSVIIALKEQEIGNYRLAHKTLVEASRMLRDKQMRVPNDLRRCFMLLHSYVIVKDLIKVLQDEATGTRMLLRVARNIQKFPRHIPEILCATVTQCAKTNFRKSAFEFACLLIQNEKYRVGLAERDRKRIEGIVRKSGKDDLVDPAENSTKCPYCDAPVPETELDCGGCKNMLPFCVVTGKHVVSSDFSLTPCCGFPCTYSALLARLKSCNTCPACNAAMDLNKIERQVDFDFRVLQ
eukprot:gene3725-2623_t